ncbi:hypothetical protein GOP47_0005783, partial [Adiantum capillus-veneris]
KPHIYKVWAFIKSGHEGQSSLSQWLGGESPPRQGSSGCRNTGPCQGSVGFKASESLEFFSGLEGCFGHSSSSFRLPLAGAAYLNGRYVDQEEEEMLSSAIVSPAYKLENLHRQFLRLKSFTAAPKLQDLGLGALSSYPETSPGCQRWL